VGFAHLLLTASGENAKKRCPTFFRPTKVSLARPD
jgi:hypothetical protein